MRPNILLSKIFLPSSCRPSSTKTTLTQARYLGTTTIAVINPRQMSNSDNDNDKEQKRKMKQQKKQKQSMSSKHRKQRGQSSYKFVDVARIKILGGSGGKGCLSFESKLGSAYKKRPDGGHGGNGGRVIIVASANEQSLNMSTHHYKAQDGTHGSSKAKHGRNGKDKIIKVPCGVVVKRVLGYDEVWDEKEKIARKISFDGDSHDGEFEREKKSAEKYNIENINPSTRISRENDIQLFPTKSSSDVIPDTELLTNQTMQSDKEIMNNIDKDKDDDDFPHDFDDIVNTGMKSEDDGMYHWRQDVDNSKFLGMGYGLNDDRLVSSSATMGGNLMEREKVTVADLDKHGSYIVIAQGGRGGVGNSAYASRQFIPNLASKAVEKARGMSGDEVHLEFELKLIADVGLVGFPNAGKSSLLAAMSKARPEIAPYPFTTLHPLVGCVEYRDGFRALVADVPGLIDGAAVGRGRGHGFLKHLERTKALLYIVDAAGVDGRDPLDDLTTLVDEIQSYGDGDMMTRPALVVANKLDLIRDSEIREELCLALNKVAKEKGIISHEEILCISAGVTGEGLGDLSKSIRGLVELGKQYRLKTNKSWESYAD